MAYLAHVIIVIWCATVSLTVIPSFSDITDVSTIGHSFKTNNRCTPFDQIKSKVCLFTTKANAFALQCYMESNKITRLEKCN